MSDKLKEEVKLLIKSDKVVIFSKTYCPHCTKAKDLFKQLVKDFKVVELDTREDGGDMQDILKDITGFRTVPQVFVNEKCLGGNSDVQKLHSEGKLVPLLG